MVNRARYVDRQAREGAPYTFQVAPVEIIGDAGRVAGVRCVRTEPGPLDAGGRPEPVPVPDSTFEVACDAVVVATGETADLEYVPDTVERTASGTLRVDPVTFATNLPRLYAVGTVADADSTTAAFASGFACAQAIDIDKEVQRWNNARRSR